MSSLHQKDVAGGTRIVSVRLKLLVPNVKRPIAELVKCQTFRRQSYRIVPDKIIDNDFQIDIPVRLMSADDNSLAVGQCSTDGITNGIFRCRILDN